MQLRIAFVLMLSSTALAQMPPGSGPQLAGMAPEAFLKEWGQVIYCQDAYGHESNRERVYEYDTKQCARADAWFQSQLAGFDDRSRALMRNGAVNQSQVIRANTRDITKVLSACRNLCKQWATRMKAPAEATQDHP